MFTSIALKEFCILQYFLILWSIFLLFTLSCFIFPSTTLAKENIQIISKVYLCNVLRYIYTYAA